MTQQIQLRELLKDPQYRAWFSKVPKLTTVHHSSPWRLFLQKEEGGKWARADVPTYVKAYSAVKLRLSDYFDITIHSKPQAFKPPVVEFAGKRIYLPLPDDHTWCVYCRRPTVFAYFTKHPNMPKIILAEYELRCGICGGRAAGMKRYKSKVSWGEYRASQR